MKKIDTACVQSGYTPKKPGDPRVLPIYQSTTFYYDQPETLADVFDLKVNNFMYSRIANPTLSYFEEKVAALEGGAAALATSSGQAALLLAVLNVCKAGDHILASSAIYGGSHNLLGFTLKKFGIETTFISPEVSEKELDAAVKDNTKILFGETIANPAMAVLDFEKFARVAKKHKILFVVDNTLATPCLCRPLEWGANIVTHSTTKYLDGHACSLGGIIVDGGNFEFLGNEKYPEFNEPDESYHGLTYAKDCGKTAYIFKARVQLMRDLGVCQSPQNAFLTNLGAETLHLRMARHSENALAVAEMLSKNKSVEWVKYPLLKGDKYNALAKKYLPEGAGGMVSFGIKGETAEAYQFIKSLKLLKLVTHVADARSCLLHPASTTHRQLSDEGLAAAGITKNLIRLSIGIEDKDDILADIEHALGQMRG